MFANQPLPEVICPYCQQQADLVKGEDVLGSGMAGRDIWYCRPCEAWTGCHPKSNFKPLGRLANKALRKAKQDAHGAFDRVVRLIMKRDCVSLDYARRLGYDWLAVRMEIARRDCHIGSFTEELCAQAAETCRSYLAEQNPGQAA